MIHMSEVIDDLVGRIAKLEDKENVEDAKAQRKTRSTPILTQPPKNSY
jgi:hypothetical protein